MLTLGHFGRGDVPHMLETKSLTVVRSPEMRKDRAMGRFTPPTPRSRRLGRELRKLREGQNIKVEEAAKLLQCSPSRISRIESGEIRARPGDIMELLLAYNAPIDSEHGQSLVELARDLRESGWWRRLGALSSKYATFIAYEAEARELRHFEPNLVPGLLQTEAYARAVISVRDETWRTDDDTVAQLVDARLTRQAVLHRSPVPLKMHTVLAETALRIEVGSPDMMREQLQHLIHLSKLPNITIQILRFGAGAHLATRGGFAVLNLERGDPPLGYTETMGGELFLESPEEIKRLNAVYDHLRMLAMSPAESTKFLREQIE